MPEPVWKRAFRGSVPVGGRSTRRLMASPSFLLLAGEASGDLHGAELARSLRERFPACRLIGMGGDAMAAQGVELFAGLDELAVMGFVEVLSRVPFFWRLERRVKDLLESGTVDLVIPIDYPGFNLRVTESANRRGIPVLYYIAPQVWAWKAGRTRKLARAAERIAVILPFEERLFRAEGGMAEFVGHPLLDRPEAVPDRQRFCREEGFDPDRPILALFPGSRRQEIGRHLAIFLDAAGLLAREHPGLQVGVARAGPMHLDLPSGPDGATAVGDGRALLRHARAAIVKSGTSTLEAALEGTPFVVAYRTHPLTFAIARRVVKVDHVALANLVVGERVVPELLQGRVTPRALAAEVGPLLPEGPARTRMRESLARVRSALGGVSPGASERVAEMAAEILRERRTMEASTHGQG